MKKLISTVLAASMILAMTACGSSSTATETTAAASAAKSETEATADTASTAEWPQGDITVVVPAAAGGGTDIFARIVTDYLQRSTGKTFTVVNVDAGSGMVGFEQTRNAKPDGTTIMFWHTGFYVTSATGQYEHNPNGDFSPLVMFNPVGNDGKQVFVVKGDAKWNTLEELLDDAKANPGTITYGCSAGGSAQMVAEMLMKTNDSELRLVDAASQTDKITGVAGGNIDVSAITLASALQYVESGDLKILAVVDKEGTDDYKSAYELGYEDCYWSQNLCVYGPAGMDESLCRAINEAFQGIGDDETAMSTMESSKMVNVPLNYDDSIASFKDYETSVTAIASTMTE